MATAAAEEQPPQTTTAQKRLKPTSFDDTCYQIQLHEHNSHLEDSDDMQVTPRSAVAAGVKLKRSHSFSDLQQQPQKPHADVQVLTEGHLTDVEMLVEESGENEVDNAFLANSESSEGSESVPMSPRMPLYGKFLRGVQKSLRVIFRCASKKQLQKDEVLLADEVKMQAIPPVAGGLMTQMTSADDEVSIRQKIKSADNDEMNTFVIDVPLSSSKVNFYFYVCSRCYRLCYRKMRGKSVWC